MDLWNKARGVAEEAAKRSQELTIGGSKLSEIVADAAKRSKEIAAKALKRTDEVDKQLTSATATKTPLDATQLKFKETDLELEAFGITEELRDFAKGITFITFKDFPLQDDTQFSEVPTVTNVRQDLSEWQEKHASLVLSIVKEISQLRYELCPRIMKERKFWRIYFILVNNHVAPYEKRYNEDVKLKSSEQLKAGAGKEPTKVEITCKPEGKETQHQSTTSTVSTTEQDLDAFLLGDPGDSDDHHPDDGDEDFDEDFDNFSDSSDEEKDKVAEKKGKENDDL